MLRAVGIIQLALAPVFVLPAVTGQDDTGPSLEAQLEATATSIEYLVGVRDSVRSGAKGSVTAVLGATEVPRETSPRRAEEITNLSNDVARLRFELDKLLADPVHVEAITAMPADVVRALGLGGAPSVYDTSADGAADRIDSAATDVAPIPSIDGTAGAGSGPAVAPDGRLPLDPAGTVDADSELERALNGDGTLTPNPWSGMSATVGLDDAMRDAIRRDVGPLDAVSNAARRRGEDALALEDPGYVADPTRLGKLLVRAGRAAEAIEVLKHESGHAPTYWLARAYQDQDRTAEALALFRALAADEEAGVHGRRAQQDLDFLEFQTQFERSLQR